MVQPKRILIIPLFAWAISWLFLLIPSCRSRLLSDGPFNGVLLGPTERQALWHVTCQSFPQGRGAGKGHVGGGRIHLQLQLLPDDPQVSHSVASPKVCCSQMRSCIILPYLTLHLKKLRLSPEHYFECSLINLSKIYKRRKCGKAGGYSKYNLSNPWENPS